MLGWVTDDKYRQYRDRECRFQGTGAPPAAALASGPRPLPSSAPMPPKKPARPKSPASATPPGDEALRARVVDMLVLEILDLATEPVEAVVDGDAVRALLLHGDDLVRHDVVADLAATAAKQVRAALARRPESPRELLDADLAALVDARLDADLVLSADAKDLIGRMMRQELVQDLFTNVIHTAIVSFNKRVNPLFGGLATAMLEDQIKGFIRFFIPMVLDQATAFVVASRNRGLFSDFARTLVRELLDEPLPSLLTLAAAEDEGETRRVAAAIAASPRLRHLGRDLAVAAWDRIWTDLRRRRIGDVVRLDEHAGWLAEQLAPGVVRALARPHLRAFLAAEFAASTSGKPPRAKKDGKEGKDAKVKKEAKGKKRKAAADEA